MWVKYCFERNWIYVLWGRYERGPDPRMYFLVPGLFLAPSRRSVSDEHFNAGGSFPEGLEPSHVASSQDKRRIYLRGFAVDTFSKLSTPFPIPDGEDISNKQNYTLMWDWLHQSLGFLLPFCIQDDNETSVNPLEAFLRAISCVNRDTQESDIDELR
jgi:hypothetical protein